jgi:hypothetical protein
VPYLDPVKQKEAQSRYYRENRAKLVGVQRDRRSQFRKVIDEVKTEAVCADCGIDYPPYIMDFDHVRGVKKCGVSQVHLIASLEALYEEIAKCDVVCANCHRHRTWMRLKK